MIVDKKYLLDTVSQDDINDIVDDLKSLYAIFGIEHNLNGTHALVNVPWNGVRAFALAEGGEPDTVGGTYYATLMDNHYNINAVASTVLGYYRFTFVNAMSSSTYVVIPSYYGTSSYRANIGAITTTYCEVLLIDASDTQVSLPEGEYISIQAWEL